MQDLTTIFDISKQIIDIYANILNSEGYGNSSFNPPNWTVEFNGSIYQLTLRVPPYWKYVEYGTQPHDITFKNRRTLRNGVEIMGPPINILAEWLTVKKGVPQGSAKGIAFAIDRNLAKNNGKKLSHPGTSGKHMLQKTLQNNELVNELTKEITKLISKDATTEIKTMFDGMESFTKK